MKLPTIDIAVRGVVEPGDVLLGGGVALLTLSIGGEPQPGWEFVIATLILTTAAATLGAVPPSIVASRRDPLTELRVP